MSTRARIGIENDDGTVTSVYTHFDGYPTHHAPILTESYSEPEKLRELLALGDMSILAPEIGRKHSFDGHSGNIEANAWCLFYDRDRGESDVAAVTHPADTWPDYGHVYEYLLRPNGWTTRERQYRDHEAYWTDDWRPLAEAYVEAKAEEDAYLASQDARA